MRLSSTLARSVAALSVVALTCAPVAVAAAEPGQGSHEKGGDRAQGHGPAAAASADSQSERAGSKGRKQGQADQENPGQGPDGSKDRGKGQAGSKDQGPDKDKGPGKAKGQAGTQGKSQGKGQGQGKGDPAGNNGTVKIAPLGEMDRIPNNTPHPGCTFQIEWYGFDEGEDVVSTVSFAMHAPTRDVALSVDGKSTVFVGGDPASGAGTESGLDGREAYTLSFDGEPHPKQGYHVKLTVATPRSQGNDTKTKVFWVEPCDEDDATGGGTTPGSDGGSDEDDESGVGGAGSGRTSVSGSAEGDQGDDDSDEQVLAGGGSTDAESGSSVDVSDDAAQVPTAVDAGDGGSALDWARSPVGLLIIGAGALLTAGGFLLRRRAGLGSDA
ncbi:hypothetical protein [Nocardioides sp.]|uniref:hypothetical protein n=1 Tax=Nocardioides sp. TaxID=35761 RepID=UPI00356711ED